MFDIKNTKTFMDSVHGYINIPKCFVEYLIDTEYFQRLRNIDQTGMRILYPDGKHDRFGHSLGVFYLGNKAVNSLLENFSNNEYWNVKSDHTNTLFWAKNKVLFLIACLLHDIGHAPFSHSLEKEIHKNSGGLQFKEKLATLISNGESGLYGEQKLNAIQISASPHEQLGAVLILDKLKENIAKIYDSLISDCYPTEATNSILFAEHYNNKTIIDKNEFDADICFVARMILGFKYEGFEPEKQIKNCFIELLNGSNFDVDKLDYVVRDTKMSGISNISIDIDRLLKSVSIIPKTIYKDKKFENDFRFSGLTIHSLGNRDSNESVLISGSFNGCLIIQPQTRIKITKGSTFSSLNGTTKDACIKYVVEPAKFSSDTTLYKDGVFINKHSSGEYKKLPENTNDTEFNCVIKDATVISDDFYFDVCSSGAELWVNGKCEIELSGNFFSKSSVTFFKDTKINGLLEEVVVLDNLIKNEVPTSSQYNTFSVGFKKQAINIIANVLEARDYLYLWCYAHHKVIYYANFLIPSISMNIFSYKDSKSVFPSWKLNYNDLCYLDDAYIWTVVRYLKNTASKELNKLCGELLSRKYKKSLWKSLAEYDLIFESFTVTQKSDIQTFFALNINKKWPCVYDKDNNMCLAGFLDERLIKIFQKEDELFKKIDSIVYANASYTQKNTDAHNTLIQIGDVVAPMDKIPLLTDRIKISNSTTNQYFYLYYDVVDGQEITLEENEKLKLTITKFLNANINCLNIEDVSQKYSE